jgi:hypothetical protein
MKITMEQCLPQLALFKTLLRSLRMAILQQEQ